MKKIFVYGLCASILLSTMNLTPIYAENSAYASGDTEIIYNYDGSDHSRMMESLGRGLVAVKTDKGVYLSWRLLGTESSVKNILLAPDFEVYKNGTKLCEVTNSTNYLDTTGTVSDTYTVAVIGGEQCESVSVWNQNYTDIALDKPEAFVVSDEESYEYSAGDASCGDLDGDGEYEIVLKWNCNAKDNSHSGITGNVYLDAYELDGTKMWRIDLGRNIRSGEHYTQFLVYDFDMDGYAEITCKTAPGSLDASGEYVSAASSDSTIQSVDNSAVYVNDSGYILEGEEFFTIFDGKTGTAIDTINYPNARVSASSWGDAYGNRCDRFLASVATMDGEKPYAVYWRGYYGPQSGFSSGRTGIFCASFDGERLNVDDNHIIDTMSGQPGYSQGNESIIGQGNHNMTVADVDDDGKDEFISGPLCMELDDSGKLSIKWNTGLGHGDALHIGDYDPTHIGLEYFCVHEASPYGSSVIDPATGEILFHSDGSSDTGRGTMMNVGAGGYYQITDAKGNYYYAMGNGVFEAGVGIGWNFRVFWDSDLYDEVLDGTTIRSWNGSAMSDIYNTSSYGCTSINGTKAVPSLQADLFGDWREEVIYPTSDNSALRVFTTTDLTEYKLPTLMHDPVYRSGVSAEQTSYNQPPHIGFYLSEEIFKPEVESIEVTQLPDKTTYFIGDKLDTTGLVVTANYNDGSSEEVSGYILSGFDTNSSGEQTITVTYARMTAEFTVTVESGFEIDEYGYVTGYKLDFDSATLPETVNGITVVGFADNALAESGIKTLTVLAGNMVIGKNVFPSDITIVCYPGTDIYNYAVENGLNVEAIDTYEYTANITYSETEYTGFSMLQSGVGQSKAIGHFNYAVGGRSDRNGPAGDGNSGFSVVDIDGETVLNAGVGRFGDERNSRYARFTLTDIPMLSDETDSVFETDIMFLYNDGREAVLTIYDSSGVLMDTVSIASLGLENDVWYTYKLICHKGVYYRMLCIKGETATPIKIAETTSEYGITTFKFLRDASGASIDNGESANIYFDNTKIYTNIEFANLQLNIIDENGKPVSKPDLVINGEEARGSSDGVYSAEVFSGTYTITISADGYESQRLVVGAYKSEVSKTVVLTAVKADLTGISFAEDTLALKTGTADRMTASAVPENAENEGIIYSSSDESVAAVDKNGVVTAKSAGTAVITATSVTNPDFTDTCEVSVVDNNYTSTLTTIKVVGDKTAYIPNISGMDNSVKFTAKGYDQNGVLMTIGSITWSVTGGLSIKSGSLVIPAGTAEGTYTVSVKNSRWGVTGSTTIELSNFDSDIIAEELLEQEMSISQGKIDTVVTIDDITYHSGARGEGGEIYTGFVINSDIVDGKKCLTAKTGQWADPGRAAYMVFDKADQEYSTLYDYVFETDIYFKGTSKMVFCDNSGNTVFTIDAAGVGLEQNTWYHYMLIYSEGKYTQYIFDADGNILSISDVITQSSGMISVIQFHKVEENNGVINLSELKYYTVKNALSVVYVRVIDKNENPVPNTEVTVNTLTAQTDSSGRAMFTLPMGTYTATVSDPVTGSVSFTADGSGAVYTIAETPDTKIVSGYNNTVVLSNPNTGYTIYAADYNDDGTLAGVSKLTSKSASEFYVVATDIDKVFLWSDMTPVDTWTKGE